MRVKFGVVVTLCGGEGGEGVGKDTGSDTGDLHANLEVAGKLRRLRVGAHLLAKGKRWCT